MFGKDTAKQKALDTLEETYQEIATRHKLSLPDFPDPDDYRKFFAKVDMCSMHRLEGLEKDNTMNNLKSLIEVELPRLLKPIKSAVASDPRDRKAAMELQREYTKNLADQLAGKMGVQGSLGEMALAPALSKMALQMPMQSAAPASPKAGQMTMPPDQMAAFMAFQQQQLMLQQAAAAKPAVPPQMTQEQMMQMMMMMQQQQQK